ncbi:MAG: DUF3943 domain-containing protein [Deltaproteobacteria bacterium]|nr:DUF3943 domain-containing protein [Deltaproteobacteria bacterium]
MALIAAPAQPPPPVDVPPAETTPDAAPLTPPNAEAPPPQPLFTKVPPKSYWVPAVEALTLGVGIVGYDRWVAKDGYAQVTPDSIGHFVITQPWFIDGDQMFMNFVAHPYMGSLAYNIARSNQLSYWESLGYTTAFAAAFELAGELQNPSINDLVNGSVGGSYFGETFHRLTEVLIQPGAPGAGPLRLVGGFLLDPMGSFNREVLGKPQPYQPEQLPQWQGRLYAGGLLIHGADYSRGQVVMGLDFSAGFPDDRSTRTLHPFDYMDMRFDYALIGRPNGDIMIRGLLAGGRLQTSDAAGAAGLYGLYDFDSGPDFRVSATSAGPGISIGMAPGTGLRLRATAVAAAVLMGASGTDEQADFIYKGPDFNQPPIYEMGPGAEGLVDSTLDWKGIGQARLIARSWLIGGVKPIVGLERDAAVTLGAATAFRGWPSLGVELSAQGRIPADDHAPSQWGWIGRATVGAPLGDW